MNLPSLRTLRTTNTAPAPVGGAPPSRAIASAHTNSDAQTLAQMPLAARRALMRRAYTRHAGRALRTEVLRDVALRTARPADAVGITQDELDRAERAAGHLVQQGRRREARELYRWLVSADPANCSYTLALGSLALDEGAHDEAERWFTAAIDALGGDLGAHAGRAIARATRVSIEHAKSDIELAIELDPEATHALTVRMAQFFTEASAPPRRR